MSNGLAKSMSSRAGHVLALQTKSSSCHLERPYCHPVVEGSCTFREGHKNAPCQNKTQSVSVIESIILVNPTICDF